MADCDNDLVGACIARKRGDTAPDKIFVLDAESVTTPKAPLDITGFAFKMTLNTEQDPDPGPPIGNEIVSIDGNIVDALNGEVEFPWSTDDADQVPEDYFYDIQQTDASSRILTIAKEVYKFQQDITKT